MPKLYIQKHSRSVMRKHANVAYNQQRLADGNMFTTVRLQSWFGEKRERYREVVEVDDNNNNNDDNNDDSHQVVWEHQAIQEDAGGESNSLEHQE
jgi:hypothetical protein